MTRYLLDTNIVSEMGRSSPDANVDERYQDKEAQSAISSVVWHELLYGVERLDPGQQRDTLMRYLREVVRRTLPILPFGEAAGHWFARERVRLERIGQEPSLADGMIAATAAANDLILVTRNTSDFERFDGLHVENWFDK